ncbi:MAG: LamB/YcsF family protein [Xanthobacteraceae bacterium]|nr:LamB/YcsF family protein [Xanthobacteraceae bacterium]
MKVDLNSDLGEGFGSWQMGDDKAMLDIATSVNVACGFHAGDPDIMCETARLAKERGVSIGAHPSYRDLAGFGRRPMPDITAREIENLVAYQIGALQAVAALAGHRVTHVKPHGALSNVACNNDLTADAVASAIKAADPNLLFVVLPHTAMARAAERAGLKAINEIYADRAYEDDAQLVSRRKNGAVLHDPALVAGRALKMIEDQAIFSVDGKRIPTRIDTICVHGDTPGAVAIAKTLRATLERNGVKILPFNSR